MAYYARELEAVDTAVDLMDIYLDGDAPLQTDWRDDILLEKVMVIKTKGYAVQPDDWQDLLYRPVWQRRRVADHYRMVPLTAVPYYAWANRGPGMMRVWIPRLDNT